MNNAMPFQQAQQQQASWQQAQMPYNMPNPFYQQQQFNPFQFPYNSQPFPYGAAGVGPQQYVAAQGMYVNPQIFQQQQPSQFLGSSTLGPGQAHQLRAARPLAGARGSAAIAAAGGGGGSADPSGLLQQLLQLADQVEQENNRLSGAGDDDRRLAPSELSLNDAVGEDSAVAGLSRPHIENLTSFGQARLKQGEPLFTLKNNNNNNISGSGSGGGPNAVRYSRAELKYQEEIRLLQLEAEKMRHQKTVDDMRQDLDRQRQTRALEDTHSRWVTDQKQQLQAAKLQQALAKEQRILAMQLEGDDSQIKNNVNNGDSQNAGPPPAVINPPVVKTKNSNKLDLIREASGAGVKKLPLDLLKSVAVFTDGVLVPLEMQVMGGLFRVAVGVYDESGKCVARLSSSEWQHWAVQKMTISAAAGGGGAVTSHTFLDFTLKKIVKQQQQNTGNTSGGGSSSVGVGCKYLVELQTKISDTAPGFSSAGWGLFGLVQSSSAAPNDSVLNNGLWRIPLRVGITDPSHALGADGVGGDIALGGTPLSSTAFALVRVMDGSEAVRAQSWSAATDLTVLKDTTDLYLDPREVSGSNSNNTVADSTVPAQSLGAARPRTTTQQQAAVSGPTAPTPGKRGSTPVVAPASLRPMSSSANAQAAAPLSLASRPPTTLMSPIAEQPQAQPQHEEEEQDEAANNQSSAIDGQELEHSAANATSYWQAGTPSGPATVKYQRGDGVDVYVDGAMYLPDNCTASRVVLSVYTSDKVMVGSQYLGYSSVLESAMSPSYNMKAECRSAAFNATCMVVIRVDTLDCWLQAQGVGYAVLKMFCSKDRKLLKQANDPAAFVNTGLYQLPLFSGRVPAGLEYFDDTMLQSLVRIPCASVLVRVCSAPKSADGMTVLCREDFAREEWPRLMLDIPAPAYSTGSYNGSECEPVTALEKVCYDVKTAAVSESVLAAVSQAMALSSVAHSLPEKPLGANAEGLSEWVKTLLPPPADVRTILDCAWAAPYSMDTGVQIAVDQLCNMPERGLFSSTTTLPKVIYSISPPGLFYKDPPLNEGVSYTLVHDLDRHECAPAFQDGYVEFSPPALDATLYLILDVRLIRIDKNPSGGANDDPVISVEPAVGRKSYWTIFPLAVERMAGRGFSYVNSGLFQLALIEGAVPAQEILSLANPYEEVMQRLAYKGKDTTKSLKLSDASILIRVVNPLLRDLVSASLSTAGLNTGHWSAMLQAAGVASGSGRQDKMRYDDKRQQLCRGGKKALSAMLPKVADTKKFLKNVNKAFASSTGVVEEL